MAKCCQCGNNAMFLAGEDHSIPLCNDCHLKFQQALQMQQAALTTGMNFLADMMEATTGVYGVIPRHKVPTPVHMQVKQGPTTFNNINVDRSVIGSINTGEVGSIDVAMDSIGDPQLVKALKDFTEAVINNKEMELEKKNEVIEQLAFLSSQATVPSAERKPSIIRTVIASVASSATTAGLAQAWTALSPLLQGMIS